MASAKRPHYWEKQDYINSQNLNVSEPDLPHRPTDDRPASSGISEGEYLKPKPVHSSNANRAVVQQKQHLTESHQAAGSPQVSSRPIRVSTLPARSSKQPPPSSSGRDEAANSVPDLPPRPPHRAEPEDDDSPPSQPQRVQSKTSKRCQAGLLTVQLLLIVGFSCYVWLLKCSTPHAWIRLSPQTVKENCSADNVNIRFTAADKQKNEMYWAYNSSKHSVIVKTNGDYRIAAKVCFTLKNGTGRSLVSVSIRVSSSNDSQIRVLDQCQVSSLQDNIDWHDCCTLFAISTLSRGDAVSVSSDGTHLIACQENMTSFSLELMLS